MAQRILAIATLADVRFLPAIFEQFEAQDYPNKLLLVVYRKDLGDQIKLPLQDGYARAPSEPGVSNAVNVGIDFARWHRLPLWARIDQDDIYGPRWLSCVAKGLERYDVVGLREHDIEHIGNDGAVLERRRVHHGESSRLITTDTEGLAGATLGCRTDLALPFPPLRACSHFIWARRMRREGRSVFAMGGEAIDQFTHRKIDGHDHVFHLSFEAMTAQD